MKIIKQTIKYLDVPFGEDGAVAASDAGQDNGQRVMKKYPLTTLDPETFITTLEEIGSLSPSAEFKVDKKSKTLFALAVESDHAKIVGLIDQFDGSGREFQVIQLRRLPADAVANTIYNLMAGQQEEEQDNNRRPYWYYDPWDRQEEEDKPVKGFGVDADIENNRLMLWANEAEFDRVRDLLVKLGEIPEGQQDVRRVRFVQPGSDVPAAKLLEQIREAWSASGNNELIIKLPPQAEPSPAETEKKDTQETEDAAPAEESPSTKDRTAGRSAAGRVYAQFVQLGAVNADTGPEASVEDSAPDESVTATERQPTERSRSESAAALAKPSPVTISVTEDGRLMISSSDPVALDRMEELIEQLTPPDKRYKVYRLQFISALNMYWNLTDFFKEDLEGEGDGNDFFDFYWGYRGGGGGQDNGPAGLSKRRKLIISYDTPSNSILVANASPSQLREVEGLIAEYDKAAPADSVRTRRTVLLKIKYSKATEIAEALKEVYRDLLSSKDKEFDRGGDQRQRGSSTERVTVIRYGDGSGGNQRPSPVKVGFEGALSIGVDDVSNTLLLSVQEELYESVVQMVQKLDEEAAPNTVVRVHRVNGNVSAEALRKTINDALGNGTGQEARGPGERDGQRRDGDRNRDRRRRDRDRNRGERGSNDNNNGDQNRDND
jgi:type II secretory pathway component GspD/PulD (secretin)